MGTKHSKALQIGAAFLVGGTLLYLLDDSSASGVSGISNLGNTCFLNAILQALSSCTSFTTFLSKLRPLQSREDSESLIVKELFLFLQSLSTGRSQSPDDLITALSQKFPYFGEQHDSHEIFYVINESLSLIKKRTDNCFMLSEGCKNPLLGLMRTEIVCSTCNNKTQNFETIFDVSVNVSGSLEESFKSFMCAQALDDFLCIKCSADASLDLAEKSKKLRFGNLRPRFEINDVKEEELLRKIKTKAFIRTAICKFPVLLCVHCKWLVGKGGILHKSGQKMHFPLKFEVSKGVYELRAVVEHAGGGYGGHYFTYKLFESDWYFCSDLEVRVVNIEQVLKAQAYMLFYELLKS